MDIRSTDSNQSIHSARPGEPVPETPETQDPIAEIGQTVLREFGKDLEQVMRDVHLTKEQVVLLDNSGALVQVIQHLYDQSAPFHEMATKQVDQALSQLAETHGDEGLKAIRATPGFQDARDQAIEQYTHKIFQDYFGQWNLPRYQTRATWNEGKVQFWQVEKRLGAGTMSRVYRVQSLTTEQKRALKVPVSEDVREAAFRDIQNAHEKLKMLHQGKIQSGLEEPSEQPGVQKVYAKDFAELHEVIPDLHLTPQQELTMKVGGFRDLVSGLAHSHSLGLPHGDIKAMNIFVDVQEEGKVTFRISDWGGTRTFKEIMAGEDVVADRTNAVGTAEITRRVKATGVHTHTYLLRPDAYKLQDIQQAFDSRSFEGVEAMQEIHKGRDVTALALAFVEALQIKAPSGEHYPELQDLTLDWETLKLQGIPDEMIALLQEMVDPDKRPSAEEAFARMDEIVKNLERNPPEEGKLKSLSDILSMQLEAERVRRGERQAEHGKAFWEE